MVDVDGMKAVNDTYGHIAGDAVLRTVSRLLARGGAIVGRYGGDEFLVLLPDARRSQAQAYLDGVLTAARGVRVTDDQTGAQVQFAMSAGISVFPDEALAIIDLIRIADAAMYAAKLRNVDAEGRVGRRLTDRVSRLIEDLVPLLTSPVALREKLALVAQRLSEISGYDAVECRLFPGAGDDVTAHCVLVDGKSGPQTEAWRLDQAEHVMPDDRPTTSIMAKTLRPVLTDDVQSSDLLTSKQKRLLSTMGIHSAMSVPMVWEGQMIGQLSVASRTPAAFTPSGAQFLASVASQLTAVVRMATLVDGLQDATHQLESAQAETVMMLAAAAEAHDRTTGEHLQRIRTISETLARELGYEDAEVHALGLAATLHDIGKISVPDAILSSPMRFDYDDWETSRIWASARSTLMLLKQLSCPPGQ